MSKLSNIAPERVDAVDEPATGRRWLLQKSSAILPRPATAAAPAASAQLTAQTATVVATEKDAAGTGVDPAQLEQLARVAVQSVATSDQDGGAAAMTAWNALATFLGEAPCFPDTSAGEVETEMAKSTPDQQPASSQADMAAAVATAVTAALAPVIKSLSQAMSPATPAQPAAKPAPAPSRQAPAQDTVQKRAETPAYNEGMFANIIFAQPSTAPRSDR